MYAPHLEHPHPIDSLCLDLDEYEDEDEISLLRELNGSPLLPYLVDGGILLRTEETSERGAAGLTERLRVTCCGLSIPQASHARYRTGLMQVQIEQVHWSGLKGSEMSMGAMGELREVSERREEGGGMCGAGTALRFWGAVSDSWKMGETGLGAVVDRARGLAPDAE
jgi:hypothetical protein